MESTSSPTPLRIEQLRSQLGRLQPRSAQLLRLRQLDGVAREDCARLFGITVAAHDVMFLRAALEFAQLPDIFPFGEEQRLARVFSTHPGDSSVPGRLRPAVTLLHELQANAQAIKEQQVRVERAHAQSPQRERETWLRWALIALIVALTGYFYLRQRPSPKDTSPALQPR